MLKSAVSFLVLLSGVFSLEHECDSHLVLVPKDFETFECWTNEQLESWEHIKTAKRFDAEHQTLFYLWTQQTEEAEREELEFNDPSSLTNSSFNPRNPTRILIHGWRSDWTSEAVEGLAKAYIAKGAYNVIGVDWSAGASSIIYPTARMRVGIVASTLAKQISLLLQAGQQPSQVVVIGHSLGAHIAGLTGKHFQDNQKLAAVLALDPAGPLFSESNPSERVDRNDARYVEIIHTNMRLLGHRAVLGQADFFPNGGRSQAGCFTNSCSHHRAVEYFRQSLESSAPLYIGQRCETDSVGDKCSGIQAVMGSDLDDDYKIKTRGVFFLKIDE